MRRSKVQIRSCWFRITWYRPIAMTGMGIRFCTLGWGKRRPELDVCAKQNMSRIQQQWRNCISFWSTSAQSLYLLWGGEADKRSLSVRAGRRDRGKTQSLYFSCTAYRLIAKYAVMQKRTPSGVLFYGVPFFGKNMGMICLFIFLCSMSILSIYGCIASNENDFTFNTA